MRKSLLTTGIAGLLLTTSALAADLADELDTIPASAELVVRGKAVPMNEALQSEVVDMLKGVLGGCKTDSKTRPSAFRKYDRKALPFDWNRARDPLRRVSYISASLGKLEKLNAGNKSVYAKHIMLETPGGNWPKKYAVIYDGRQSIRFTNCNGYDVVELICSAGIREHMPERYLAACKALPPGMKEAVMSPKDKDSKP